MKSLLSMVGLLATVIFAVAPSAAASAEGRQPQVNGIFGEDEAGYRCGDDVCARSERCCLAAKGDDGSCSVACTRGVCVEVACRDRDPEDRDVTR